jgi:hypothetical protein
MILLSDITLQVKVKLPYTDMMVTTSVTFCGKVTNSQLHFTYQLI